ncbi:hypothetical protein SAMN04515668_4089 [Hymenobacter arizonensis]|uniref:Uncharacterized protein n=1 Tax=Hymenobacter arizonensis TaxID=1227077 RepID=A0A1I6AZM6_HYMAR|nr:hypothetical protein SAMN04515668_4089 [Hymenobacter arizonensis]
MLSLRSTLSRLNDSFRGDKMLPSSAWQTIGFTTTRERLAYGDLQLGFAQLDRCSREAN